MSEIRVSEHIVQFYEADAFLISRLADFLKDGFATGANALAIATPNHCEALKNALTSEGFDVLALIHSGKLRLADPQDFLACFMVDGMPDAARFRSKFDELFAAVAASEKPVRVYGDMVGILWTEGREAAAIALEKLLTEALQAVPVKLMCGYSIHGMHGSSSEKAFQEICSTHSLVLPTESYSDPSLTEADRMRLVAALQQRSVTLEGQTRSMGKQLEDLQQLQTLEFRLSRSGSLEETLQQTLRDVLAVFRSRQGLLYLVSPDRSGLQVSASIGFTAESLSQIATLPLGLADGQACLERREPVVFEDVASDPAFMDSLPVAAAAGFRAAHSLPLINRQGIILGVLSVFFLQVHRPDEREMRMGKSCARMASDTLELASLREQADHETKKRKTAEAALSRQSECLTVLNGIAALMVTEADSGKLIQAATEGGRRLIRAEFGAYYQIGKQSDAKGIRQICVSGSTQGTLGSIGNPDENPLFARTFSGQGTVRFEDIGLSGVSPGDRHIRSFLGIPVTSRSGTVLGGFFYWHSESGIFSGEDERTLVGLAAQVAIALDNADLHDSLQLEFEQRRTSEVAAQRFAAIVRSSNDAIISKDLHSNITSWNNSAQRIFGYSAEEVIGKSITLLIPANHIDEEPEILKRIQRGETLNHYETVRRRKDGTLIDISLTVSPIKDENGVIIGASKIARDVTELKSTEEQLRQAQKMEAVGRLAGGIAHDFNNLLTSIIGYVEMALTKAAPGSDQADYLEEVRKSGHRAANLTQQLLAYSRKQILAPKIIDLNEGVLEMEKMLRRLIGEDIHFQTSLETDLGKVKADPAQIQQIIVNLALNARDAMPQGGILSLQTASVRLDREHVAAHPEAMVGPHVMLGVGDNGIGMSEEIQSRIFEPFFTTKEVGKGTGLGLSSVYGIVKQSGASITVSSRPGKGTQFRIYFPVVQAEVQVQREVLPSAFKSDKAQHGETILLAEDEATVRRFLMAILKQTGYAVIEAKDGAEALEAGKQAHRIDLLVTDMVMPNMNGGTLARLIRAYHPDLPVLYISGYTRDTAAFNGAEGPNTSYLQKPFTQADLLRRIRDSINLRKPTLNLA